MNGSKTEVLLYLIAKLLYMIVICQPISNNIIETQIRKEVTIVNDLFYRVENMP